MWEHNNTVSVSWCTISSVFYCFLLLLMPRIMYSIWCSWLNVAFFIVILFAVVVLTLTRMIKSVATGQAPQKQSHSGVEGCQWYYCTTINRILRIYSSTSSRTISSDIPISFKDRTAYLFVLSWFLSLFLSFTRYFGLMRRTQRGEGGKQEE